MLRRLHCVVSLVVIVFISAALCLSQTAPAQIEARVDALLKRLTLEEKIDLIGGVDDFYIRAIPHIGLPRLKMADGPMGVRNYGPSTALGGIGLAATWDPEIARKVGAVIGEDARARGVHFVLGPGVNIYRSPLCGRNFEYFGEDPFLSARTAVAYIEGVQSKGVSATIKHYVGNNQEYDRHNIDSIIDERPLREIYLPTFEAAVKEAHVGAIMDSYNLTNGSHMSQNGYLNNEVAKKEWGFDGIIMSDWDSTYDGVAAANGGLDLEMPSGKFMNRETLLPAIKAGKVSEATIDDKVRRILRTAIRFGWLDRDQSDPSIPRFNPEGRKVALEFARSSMVLLKNDGNLLPLDRKRIKSIAVIGPDAYPAQPVGGGTAEVKPFAPVSYLEGITSEAGDIKVYYAAGIPTLEDMAKQTEFSTDAKRGQKGIKAEFFHNLDLSGEPSFSRVDEHVGYDPARGTDETYADISARWTGYFTPPTPGEYMVFVQGPGENGGYRLYVDKQLVFDNWKTWYAFVSVTKLPLSAGAHEIKLEYCAQHGWGKAGLNLGIVRPEGLVSADAKALAKRSDAVVLAVGFDSEIEGEGSDRTFGLPPGQDELVNEIAALNKNTIVVLTSGGGVDMSAWIDHVPSVFESWYSGQEGGTALAQLIFGEFNPSGRLPISIEQQWEDNAVHERYYPAEDEKKVVYSEGLFFGYRYFDKFLPKPLFPFGYGLSYTSFAYKNLVLSPTKAEGDQQVTVSFDVTNTGNRAGADVAEVYVRDNHSRAIRPLKELKGFAKPYLQPGETKQVTVSLDRRAFSYYDSRSHRWMVDPGDFEIDVARSSAQIELKGKITVQ